MDQKDRFISAFLVFSICVLVAALIYSGYVFYQLRKPIQTEPEVLDSGPSVGDMDVVQQPVEDAESDLPQLNRPKGPLTQALNQLTQRFRHRQRPMEPKMNRCSQNRTRSRHHPKRGISLKYLKGFPQVSNLSGSIPIIKRGICMSTR